MPLAVTNKKGSLLGTLHLLGVSVGGGDSKTIYVRRSEATEPRRR